MASAIQESLVTVKEAVLLEWKVQKSVWGRYKRKCDKISRMNIHSLLKDFFLIRNGAIVWGESETEYKVLF